MGQEPDRIRAEIEQTRAEMTETVDALGYKADVKTRAKENLQGKRESAKESIVGVKDKIAGRVLRHRSVSDRTPDSGRSSTGPPGQERRAAEPARPRDRRRRDRGSSPAC